MVVALHTLKFPPSVPSAAQELIVGVEYGKVAFRWYWRQAVESAYLQSCSNLWEVFAISRSDSGEGTGDDEEAEREEEILEAILEDDLARGGLESHGGGAFFLDGQILII